MKQDHDCRQVRLGWMERFDGGTPEAPLASELAPHLERCAECRNFVEGTKAARSLLTALPLPPTDPAADQALLAALSRVEPSAAGWPDRLRTLFGSFRAAPLRPVLLAGVASFVLTLATGVALTVSPVGSPLATSTRPEPAPTRRAERDLETRLDDWIAQPATRPRPPQSPQPVRLRTTPLRPGERSDLGARSHAA